MKKQINRQQLKKNQTRWIITIVFLCLLITFLTPKKKEDVLTHPEPEKQTKVQAKEVVDKTLVESKIEIQKNKIVSQAVPVISAPAKKVFDQASISFRRSQAKATLGSMYLALLSFYKEHGRYTTDLYAAGFSLYGNTQSLKTGFIYEANMISDQYNEVTRESKNRMNSDFFVYKGPVNQNNKPTYTKEVEKINFKDYEKFCRNKCSADENSFEVISIIPFDDDHVDVWLMNERKEMIQVQDGLQGL